MTRHAAPDTTAVIRRLPVILGAAAVALFATGATAGALFLAPAPERVVVSTPGPVVTVTATPAPPEPYPLGADDRLLDPSLIAFLTELGDAGLWVDTTTDGALLDLATTVCTGEIGIGGIDRAFPYLDDAEVTAVYALIREHCPTK